MPSSQLEILGSQTREVAAVEEVEQVGSLDATALDSAAGHKVLEAVILKMVTLTATVRPVMEESGLEMRWGLQGRGLGILVVQERDVDARRRV